VWHHANCRRCSAIPCQVCGRSGQRINTTGRLSSPRSSCQQHPRHTSSKTAYKSGLPNNILLVSSAVRPVKPCDGDGLVRASVGFTHNPDLVLGRRAKSLRVATTMRHDESGRAKHVGPNNPHPHPLMIRVAATSWRRARTCIFLNVVLRKESGRDQFQLIVIVQAAKTRVADDTMVLQQSIRLALRVALAVRKAAPRSWRVRDSQDESPKFRISGQCALSDTSRNPVDLLPAWCRPAWRCSCVSL
jgi:hypothetical protein